MRIYLFIFLLLSSLCKVYSQTYDLIVRLNGDSIACNIDSIRDATIYFEMKNNYNWINTNISIKEVIEYQYNAIDKKMFVFKQGTSCIKSLSQEPNASIKNNQRNSVYLGISSVNYSRMIPLDQIGMTVAVGLSFLDGVAVQTETTFLLGHTKHFFEPGILWWHDNIDDFILIRTGYRYQSTKGFLFRAAPLFTFIESDPFILPSLSIGYSF